MKPPVKPPGPKLSDSDADELVRRIGEVEHLGSAPELAPRRVAPRPAQKTYRGLPPPAPGSAPLPPPPKQPAEPPAPSHAPLSVTPAPWAKEDPRLKEAVRRRGDQLFEAPRSQPAAPQKETSGSLDERLALVEGRVAFVEKAERARQADMPWWRSTSGMVKVIGAGAIALTGSTASIVAIIGALKEPTAPKLREDIDLARKEIAGLRLYVEQKDAARAEEVKRKLERLSGRVIELDQRYPAPKEDPKRAPKETD